MYPPSPTLSPCPSFLPPFSFFPPIPSCFFPSPVVFLFFFPHRFAISFLLTLRTPSFPPPPPFFLIPQRPLPALCAFTGLSSPCISFRRAPEQLSVVQNLFLFFPCLLFSFFRLIYLDVKREYLDLLLRPLVSPSRFPHNFDWSGLENWFVRGPLSPTRFLFSESFCFFRSFSINSLNRRWTPHSLGSALFFVTILNSLFFNAFPPSPGKWLGPFSFLAIFVPLLRPDLP